MVTALGLFVKLSPYFELGGLNMLKRLAMVLLTIAIFPSASLLACDSNLACDKCAKDSEFSWNPDNRQLTARLSRFYSLGHEIEGAYNAGNFAKAKALANENLELASVYRCNWNYGNAIHDANRVHGLISLRSGDVDAAAKYLLEAGKSTGSPQLDTFGPQLDLANLLLKRGKAEAVKSYLQGIKSFWKMNDGVVDAWLADIEKGGKPELNRLAATMPEPLRRLLSWLAAGWPLVVSIWFLYVQRRRIKTKTAFFLVAVLFAYAVTYAGTWIAAYGEAAILPRMDKAGETTMLLSSYTMPAIAWLLPVLAVAFLAGFFYRDAGESDR